jgi:DNA-binding NarL/FixJ family response regulator
MLTHTSHPTPTHAEDTTHGSEHKRIRVLLVDDHPAVRMGARALIDDQRDMRVVAQASSADEALRQLARPVDVAIIDYQLGGGEDGLWLTAQLKRSQNPPRVLVYSAFADGALAVMARIAGADGLLGKHALGGELCCAIRLLARGQHHLPAVSPSIAHAMRSRLARRDQAIFGMLLHRIAPDTIVERLGMSHDELHDHRSFILRAFRPERPPSALPMPARVPLDYERAKRSTARGAV